MLTASGPFVSFNAGAAVISLIGLTWAAAAARRPASDRLTPALG